MERITHTQPETARHSAARRHRSCETADSGRQGAGGAPESHGLISASLRRHLIRPALNPDLAKAYRFRNNSKRDCTIHAEMTRTRLSTAGAFVSMQLLVGAAAASPGVLLPLAEQERAKIDRSLGPGVLGEAVAAQAIDEPEHYLDLTSVSRVYRIRSESGAQTEQRFHLTPVNAETGKPTWRYQQDGAENGFIEQEPDGSFVMTGVEDAETGAVTQYQPGEPLLLKGMKPGEERKLRMAVRVYDPASPSEIAHEGVLDVNYRYLGAYRLTLPAGTYDTVLTKSSFSGKVGPAHLEDTQYRFFAPGAGVVASIERRDVSAFLLYQAHLREARLLAAPAAALRH